MVRQLVYKNQGPYIRRLEVLGKSFSFSPKTGCSFPDNKYFDKYVDALLSLPGVELVGSSGNNTPKVEPPKPKPASPSGPQPAEVKLGNAQPKADASEEKTGITINPETKNN